MAVKGKMYFVVRHMPHRHQRLPWFVESRCSTFLYGLYANQDTAKRECARYELERLVRLRNAKTGEMA